MGTSPISRRQVRYRMRDGSRLVCRLLDSGGPLSVFVDRDYDLPGFDWGAARTIIDIGAHVGSFTIWAARRAPHASLVSVEPNPQSFRLLERNIRENGLAGRVTAINAAIGGQPGTGSLESLEHSLGTRLVREPGQLGEAQVRVESMTSLLATAGIDHVDLAKIDCEGTEYEVFDSLGIDGLRRFGALACEYHPMPGRDVAEIEGSLREAGFSTARPDAPLAVLWATR